MPELFTPALPFKYKGLTATSSLSKDGKRLHLIVLNKSYGKTIDAKITLAGFRAKSAKSWTAFQEDVASIEYAEPIAKDLGKIVGGELKARFQPHSMTAIDFDAE